MVRTPNVKDSLSIILTYKNNKVTGDRWQWRWESDSDGDSDSDSDSDSNDFVYPLPGYVPIPRF